jgi:hypothetical protein
MTTGETDQPVNMLPFLSEEMERTLRLRAWKDEIFREALIANPKGVIQRLFPQCFPNGKLAEELTIKVIEEGPGTCHIVLPSLLDEFPTPEIPEEEHLELLAHMGAERRFERVDNSEQRKSQLPEKKPRFDIARKNFEREQVEQREKASESLTKAQLNKDIVSLLKKTDSDFKKDMLNVVREVDPKKQQKDLNNLIEENFPHYFPDGKIPEGYNIKLHLDTSKTLHFVLERYQEVSKDTQQSQLDRKEAFCPSNSFNGPKEAFCPSNSFNGPKEAFCPSNSFNGPKEAFCPSNSFNGPKEAFCPSNSFNGPKEAFCPSNSFNGPKEAFCPSNSFNGKDSAFCPSNSFNGKDSAFCPSNSFNGKDSAFCPSNSFNGKDSAFCPSNSFNGKDSAFCPSNSFNGKDSAFCPSNSFNGKEDAFCPSNSFNGKEDAFCPSNSFN